MRFANLKSVISTLGLIMLFSSSAGKCYADEPLQSLWLFNGFEFDRLTSSSNSLHGLLYFDDEDYYGDQVTWTVENNRGQFERAYSGRYGKRVYPFPVKLEFGGFFAQQYPDSSMPWSQSYAAYVYYIRIGNRMIIYGDHTYERYRYGYSPFFATGTLL